VLVRESYWELQGKSINSLERRITGVWWHCLTELVTERFASLTCHFAPWTFRPLDVFALTGRIVLFSGRFALCKFRETFGVLKFRFRPFSAIKLPQFRYGPRPPNLDFWLRACLKTEHANIHWRSDIVAVNGERLCSLMHCMRIDFGEFGYYASSEWHIWYASVVTPEQPTEHLYSTSSQSLEQSATGRSECIISQFIQKPPGEKETKEDGLLHGLIIGPLVLWLHDLLQKTMVTNYLVKNRWLGAATPGEYGYLVSYHKW